MQYFHKIKDPTLDTQDIVFVQCTTTRHTGRLQSCKLHLHVIRVLLYMCATSLLGLEAEQGNVAPHCGCGSLLMMWVLT